MNLIEMKAACYNKYGIKNKMRDNWSKDRTRYVRGKREVQTIFHQDTLMRMFIHEFVRQQIKAHGKKSFALFEKLFFYGHPYLASRINPEMNTAEMERQSKPWKKPVWYKESWFYDAPFHRLHYCHVSEHDATQVAFTPNEDKLLRGVQVRMKPGRYLMQFYGPNSDDPVLSEAQCKEWADRQTAAAEPVELKLVPNTDPDGWVWVYENSAPSCMRYNRSNRHLDHGLCGDNHPVRCYAYAENDLALAYIMKPGCVEDRTQNCEKNEWVVAARTIVNTEDKTWLRIYAESDTDRACLVEQLSEYGYMQSNNILSNQMLRRIDINDDIACPYLDGNYIQISVEADYLLVCDHGKWDGQNACGVINLERVVCSGCGDRVNSEEDLTYVECLGENVCDECLEKYSLAYVSRYDQQYVPNDDVFVIAGECYTEEGAESNGFVVCIDGQWYSEEETVMLENDDMVHIDDAAEDKVSKTWHLRDEMVDSVDGRIYSDNAVDAYGAIKAHIERCYALRIDDRTVYVHREFMEDPANSSHFARLGDSLIFAASGLGVPIVTAFKPTNVVDGDYVDYRGADCLDNWELPDEDEFVGPVVPINFNSNVPYLEAV